MMKRLTTVLTFSSVALMLAAAPAMAQLIFERAPIEINSPPLNEKDKTPKPIHLTLKYDVELRGEDALRLENIYALTTLTDSTGVVIAFDPPAIAALPAMKIYIPVDVLFVDETGSVVQIAPNVTLAEMNPPISAKVPVKGFVFIKAGQATARGIKPHDIVTGRMFTPAAAVQE